MSAAPQASAAPVAARLGGLTLSPRAPRIVAPFFRPMAAGALRKLRAAGLDAAELRLDLAGCETPDAAEAFMRAFAGAGLPLIVTARSAREGGKWRSGEQTRRTVLLRAVELADAIDAELSSAGLLAALVPKARALGKTMVVSCHNHSGTDARRDMEFALDYARDAGADIFKIACAIADEADAKRMLEFVRERCDEFPLIAAAMGESPLARRTRMELARTGSLIAFAKADGESAPGQWTVAETAAALRGN